jgi:predicted nucleic acid-binding Zn ribbon protein
MTTATPPRDAQPPKPDPPLEAPIRVCRSCSTQAPADGEFCPHCGARYAKRRRSRRARLLMFGLPLLILIVAGGVTAALVIDHNNQVTAQKKAAALTASRAAAARHAAQLAALHRRQAAAKLKREIASLQRDELVTSLQGAVKKDAQKDVSNGVLTGTIMKVQCQPVTAIDATASIANYTCLAATSETNGVLSGYRFTASINTSTGSYTWHLGG